jgi:hypothetical protein
LAAESRLSAESLRTQEARAQWWPKLFLSAIVGQQDLQLNALNSRLLKLLSKRRSKRLRQNVRPLGHVQGFVSAGLLVALGKLLRALLVVLALLLKATTWQLKSLRLTGLNT